MTDWTGGPEREWYYEMEEEFREKREETDSPASSVSVVWYPPPRDVNTGHRVSLRPGWRPVETRTLPWRLWIPELIMRATARYVGRARWHQPEVWFQEARYNRSEPREG